MVAFMSNVAGQILHTSYHPNSGRMVAVGAGAGVEVRVSTGRAGMASAPQAMPTKYQNGYK